MKFNIKFDTFILSVINGCGAFVAGATQTSHPQVAFWAAMVAGCASVILVAIKQLYPQDL